MKAIAILPLIFWPLLTHSQNLNRTILVYGAPTTGGHTAGGGTYPRYTYVQFSASPNPGWYLQQWNDGDTNLVRAIVLRTNITFVATFAQGAPAGPSYVTVGWNPVTGISNYWVWTGASSAHYDKHVSANGKYKKQLTVAAGSTTYIAVQSVDYTGQVSTNYSNEVVYTAPATPMAAMAIDIDLPPELLPVLEEPTVTQSIPQPIPPSAPQVLTPPH